MTTSDATLGGRLKLINPENTSGDQRMLYQHMRDSLIPWADRNGFRGMLDSGELIGPFNPYLYSPGVTPGFLAWLAADGDHTSLDKQTHEIVILTVGAVWNASYELYAHSAVARTVGISESVIDGLCRGETPDGLTPDQLIAHRFARQLTAERTVDDELYQEAEAQFGAATVVDLTYLIGIYLATCALLTAFRIPSPSPDLGG